MQPGRRSLGAGAPPLSFRIARSASPEPITADVFGWVRRASQLLLHRQRLWVPGSAARPRNDSGAHPTALMLRSPRGGRLEARGRLQGTVDPPGESES